MIWTLHLRRSKPGRGLTQQQPSGLVSGKLQQVRLACTSRSRLVQTPPHRRSDCKKHGIGVHKIACVIRVIRACGHINANATPLVSICFSTGPGFAQVHNTHPANHISTTIPMPSRPDGCVEKGAGSNLLRGRRALMMALVVGVNADLAK